MTPNSKPKLRETLQFFFPEDESVPHFFVQDPDGYLSNVDRLHRSTLGLLQYFDGTNSLSEIHEQLTEAPPMADLVGFALQLETAYFFEGPRLEEAIDARKAWLAAPNRPAAHAGTGYPAGKHEAHAFLEGQLADAPTLETTSEAQAPIARLIAPHIDLRLGSEVHGHAHARLRDGGRPDVVVVLGVCHQATDHAFIACRKDFETPCGTVQYDAPFLDRLEAHYGEALTDGQLVHETEHSVEFQALWLAHHWPEDPPRIVPLLLRGFHEQIEAGTSPADDADVQRFVNALRAAIDEDDRRIVVIASVDLAHVGPMYDQPDALDKAAETELRRADLSLLEPIARNDAEEFYARVAVDKNARQICGVAPIYVTLRLGESEGELLRYGQGRIHPESGSVVSYAALAYV